MAAIDVVARPRRIHYPESDGMPMAETDTHRRQMIDLLATLDEHFRDKPDIYVSGNLLLYYEEGNPHRSVAPDVFVVRGVPRRNRNTYLLWEEGKGPEVVIEITSAATRKEDQRRKYELYERVLQVAEYYLYDPTGDYLEPILQGYGLREGEYDRLLIEDGRIRSAVLGLELAVHEGSLRLYDSQRGEWLRTPREEAEARRHEAEARLQAEAEVERLRTELEQLRNRR